MSDTAEKKVIRRLSHGDFHRACLALAAIEDPELTLNGMSYDEVAEMLEESIGVRVPPSSVEEIAYTSNVTWNRVKPKPEKQVPQTSKERIAGLESEVDHLKATIAKWDIVNFWEFIINRCFLPSMAKQLVENIQVISQTGTAIDAVIAPEMVHLATEISVKHIAKEVSRVLGVPSQLTIVVDSNYLALKG